MRSYSETNIFGASDRKLLNLADALVVRLGDRPKTVRCHELARAVGEVLKLPFQDGMYGFVEHTWLWTHPLGDGADYSDILRIGPNILDVYCVGRLPMVQLVDGKHTQLPHIGWSYRPTNLRTDIDSSCVKSLVKELSMMMPAKKDEGSKAVCDCWEGVNDREGMSPCEHERLPVGGGPFNNSSSPGLCRCGENGPPWNHRSECEYD